jgi:hypothetical protein
MLILLLLLLLLIILLLLLLLLILLPLRNCIKNTVGGASGLISLVGRFLINVFKLCLMNFLQATAAFMDRFGLGASGLISLVGRFFLNVFKLSLKTTAVFMDCVGYLLALTFYYFDLALYRLGQLDVDWFIVLLVALGLLIFWYDVNTLDILFKSTVPFFHKKALAFNKFKDCTNAKANVKGEVWVNGRG